METELDGPQKPQQQQRGRQRRARMPFCITFHKFSSGEPPKTHTHHIISVGHRLNAP